MGDGDELVERLLERDPYTVELDELLAALREQHRRAMMMRPVVLDPRATWRFVVA